MLILTSHFYLSLQDTSISRPVYQQFSDRHTGHPADFRPVSASSSLASADLAAQSAASVHVQDEPLNLSARESDSLSSREESSNAQGI